MKIRKKAGKPQTLLEDLGGTDPDVMRETLLQLVDYAIVEGAILRAPGFVHLMRMARLELEHWRRPCPLCGSLCVQRS